MAATTKLKTKVTYELVTVDTHGKTTRQQFVKKEYLYNDFDRTTFDTLLTNAASTLNHI